MKIRQRPQHNVRPFLKLRKPGLQLLNLFAQVGVGEHDAFRYSCCSARVLVHGHILKTQFNGRRFWLVFSNAILPCKYVRCLFYIGGELFLFCDERKKNIFRKWQIITYGSIYDLSDLCFGPKIDHPVSQEIKGDEGFRTGVIELMLELAVCVEGVIHHRYGPDLQYGKICHYAGYKVWQKNRHRIALFYAKIGEACCKSVHHLFKLAISEFVSLKDKRRLIGKLLRRPVQDVRHAYIFVTDCSRHSFLIEL